MVTEEERKIESVLNSIVSSLLSLPIRKVLLFGSYAKGQVTPDSDIDLLVVLEDYDDPGTYDEWQQKKLIVRRVLREINNKFAIDLLVYTIPQYEKVKNNMNSFQREIHETGKVLYEKAG